MPEKRVVYYSEFGAVGDGVHEDFPAIVKCHEYANENGCKVMADPGAAYYIGETGGISAIIKTDVDWRYATFILDDKNIPVESASRTADIFTISGDYERRVYYGDSDVVKAINANGGIRAADKNIGYAPGYPAMLVVFDHTHGAYIRWGVHATGTSDPQRELVTVDKDGNIDEDTKFLLDTSTVTMIWEYRIDDKPITVKNGVFVTVANCAPPVYTAYSRGISVERSNVTIRGIVHEITEEGESGAPYRGFIYARNINNLLCECVWFQSHKSYRDYNPDGSVHSIMGTYDIGGSLAANVRFHECYQTNFYKDQLNGIVYDHTERWGIMGTSYCKNLIYDECTLSRLDAHAGVYNVVIKDSTITYVTLTGGGTAVIEGSKVIMPPDTAASTLLQLRVDYGSTWRGKVLIKDTEFVCAEGSDVYICAASWHNWDFGYKTYLPDIEIDGLAIKNATDTVYIFPQMVHDISERMDEPVLKGGEKNLNPMSIDPTVTIKNNRAEYCFEGSDNPYVNTKVKIIRA